MDLEQPKTTNKNQKLMASFIAILAIVIIAVGATVLTHKKSDATAASSVAATASKAATNQNTSDSSNNASSSSNSTTSKAYKDGSYTATGSYVSPGGQESVTVHVTLKNNVVTDTSLDLHANNHDTKEYQSDFASGYKQLVVGKAIDSIHLSHVSGSSLTSQGFNDALDTIKNQAS